MEFILGKIEDLTKEIKSLKDDVVFLRDKIKQDQVWFDLKQACAMKGINYNTVVSKAGLQPRHGKADAVIAGRRRWRRETIIDWLEMTD